MVLIFCCTALFAQQKKFTISGYVSEKGSKESLIGVGIYIPKLNKGVVTNNYGFYSITLPADTLVLVITYVGYETQKKEVVLDKNISLNIEMVEGVVLQEVVITDSAQHSISQNSRMSVIELPVEQVKNIPALLGEKDVLKVILLLPGVQKGNEGSSGIYVRGGGPDQNLIILDDATVYNAYHLFGFFSLFNGDALKSIELTKGGFPARYGGRLSSVIEMNMKEGNKEQLHGEAGIGLISSRITLEGPIIKNKSSFLFSARRTYLDALIYPFLPKDTKGGYFFYDMNAKVNYDFGDKNKLYLSGYFGKDKFYAKLLSDHDTEKDNINWGNATATARWNHLYNSKLFSNASLIFTNYNFRVGYSDEYDGDVYSLRYTSGIKDGTAKYDLYFIPNTSHYIRAGVLSTYHHFTPSALVGKGPDAADNESRVSHTNALESAIYLEDDYLVNERIKINAGFRLSHFLVEGRNYLKPEPRISVRYMLKEDLSVKASYTIMNQYVHLLSNTGIGLPTDLWVPSTKNVGPQHSQQFALGAAKDLPKKNLTVSLEGYYKLSTDIIGYKEGASFLPADDPSGSTEIKWEDNITRGKSWSYGAELFIQRKFGKFTGWLGYTLSWTWMQFDSLNYGKKFFARYDRRHDISLVGIYKLNDHITISATWVFGTGNAITLPLSTYQTVFHNPGGSSASTNGPSMNMLYYVEDYGDKNAFRMTPYHRMDIGIQFMKKKKRCERTFEVGVYNVYNHMNPYFYYIQQKNGVNKLMQVSLFPIIPSVSWTYKF